MSKSKYENTISKIKTTESFQNGTIEKLKASLESEEIHNNKKVKYNYKRIGTLAASLLLVVGIGVSIKLNIPKNKASTLYVDESDLNSEYFATLPKLTVSYENGGMGFEGLCGYSIEDIDNGNPWTVDNDIKTLPVFKNKSPLNLRELNRKPILTAEEMTKQAKNIAKVMGIKVKEITVYPTEEDLKASEEKTGEKRDNTIYWVTALGEDFSVRVGTDGDVTIEFEPGIDLPDKYNFAYTQTNRDEAEEVVKYLAEEYEYIIDMKEPDLKIWGSYNFDGELGLRYDIYEGDGDLKNNIINYNFTTVSFSPNENGELGGIYINKVDISDKVGDYPIITVDKAKELLSAGNYFTSAPEKYTEDNAIEKVELVYRTNAYDKVFMPYYKFWTELPCQKLDNGLKTFVAYYVPAVEEQYLENMPKIEFRFN